MKVRADVQLILNESDPTSASGMVYVAMLCDSMGLELKIETPRERYHNGWGKDCDGAKPVLCTWKTLVVDTNDMPSAFHLDLMEDVSPLMIGLNVKIHSHTVNTTYSTKMVFRSPMYTVGRVFYTYISRNDVCDERIRVELVPHMGYTTRSLMVSGIQGSERVIAKKLHRLTHAPTDFVGACLNKSSDDV